MTRLEAERRRLGLSQSYLALLAHTQQTAISQYERQERRPTAAHLARLSEVLGVPAETLLDQVQIGVTRG